MRVWWAASHRGGGGASHEHGSILTLNGFPINRACVARACVSPLVQCRQCSTKIARPAAAMLVSTALNNILEARNAFVVSRPRVCVVY